MHIKDIKNKLKVLKKRAQGSVGTAIKVLTSVVLGAAVMIGSYGLVSEVVLPLTNERVESMFSYSSDGEAGGSGTVTPTPGIPDSLTETVSGKYICLSDVYSVEHPLNVTLTSDTLTDFSSVTVSRYGSNLLDISDMLKDNTVDNGDGTYTFTMTEANNNGRFTGKARVNIPAGTPFSFTVKTIEKTFSHNIFVEYTLADGTKDYPGLKTTTSSDRFVTYNQAVTGIRIFVVETKNNVGEHLVFSEPKLNLGIELDYVDYVEPQEVTANTDGSVQGLTSISPAMTLITNNNDVVINCEYEKERPTYNLNGKTVVNFGDSIFGNYGAPNDISTYISDLTYATTYNVGFGGCRMSEHSIQNFDAFGMRNLADAITTGDFTIQDAAIEASGTATSEATGKLPTYFANSLALLKSIDFNNVDIITIAYGTNDFTSSKSLNDVEAALRESIEAISEKYPNTEIVICSPIYRCWLDSEGNFINDSETKSYGGVMLSDYVELYGEIANEYGLLFIDNYNGSGISADNWSSCFSGTDGTHPNASARQMIAENIAKELSNYFN